MKNNSTRNRLYLYTILGVALCMAYPAAAHHILGVPHYAYDEQYPQTPVLTYKADLHDYQIEMTAFPGKPEPGERTSIHVYIRNRHTGKIHDDMVTLTITRDRLLLAGPVVYGPIEAHIEESMYKFFPNFDRDGNYSLELAFEAKDDLWIIELPIQVGEPPSPWPALAGGTAGIATLIVLARALRIKMKRRTVASARPDAGPVAEANTGELA